LQDARSTHTKNIFLHTSNEQFTNGIKKTIPNVTLSRLIFKTLRSKPCEKIKDFYIENYKTSLRPKKSK
jgi:hypothetical protein